MGWGPRAVLRPEMLRLSAMPLPPTQETGSALIHSGLCQRLKDVLLLRHNLRTPWAGLLPHPGMYSCLAGPGPGGCPLVRGAACRQAGSASMCTCPGEEPPRGPAGEEGRSRPVA